MENKISLTTLLIDIRSRNPHVQEDITQSLNERGYSDSLGDVKEKMQTSADYTTLLKIPRKVVTGLLTLHSKHHSQAVYGVAAQLPGMRYAEPVKPQMSEFQKEE